MKYNHAFTIAFEVETDNPGDKVTGKELALALCRRVISLMEENRGFKAFEEACDLPYDTYEIEDPNIIGEDTWCKFCDRICHIGDMHKYGDRYVCEECWDERLKVTE